MKRIISSAICLLSTLVAADAHAKDAWVLHEVVDKMTDKVSVFATADFTSAGTSGFVMASCIAGRNTPSVSFNFKNILVDYDSDYSGSSIIRTASVEYRAGGATVETEEANVSDDAESLRFWDDSGLKMARGLLSGRLMLRFWTLQRRNLVLVDMPVSGAADALRRLNCFKAIVPPAAAAAAAPTPTE
jgi:hypothetical protein